MSYLNINKNPNFKNSRNSSGKSFFLKEGKILNINPKDKKIHTGYFDFKNFIYNPNSDKIGSGAFGDVYLAINKLDKKEFALKHICKKRVLENNCSLSIIYQEIEIQLNLDHPNIIRLYSYYEDKENIFLILEYLNNGTLFSKIRKKKKLSEEESFNYFIQILNAINFLHENNYLHRDIKPENILLDNNNNVKLCDFGWCVNLKNNETRKTFCGTFEYMAPEIVYEENYNTSVDIWALGILLYEMLHGYSPFRAKNNLRGEDEYKDIFRNILKLEYNIEREDLSDECKDIIHKLLESDKDNRIGSKEVFSCSWVKKFEKEKKKEIIKEMELKKLQNKNDEKKNNIRNRAINALKEKQNEFFKENHNEMLEREKTEEKEKKKMEEKERMLKEKKEKEDLIQKEINNGYKPLIKKKSKSTNLLCDEEHLEISQNENNDNNPKKDYFDNLLNKVQKSNKIKRKKRENKSQLSHQEKNLIKNKSTFNINSNNNINNSYHQLSNKKNNNNMFYSNNYYNNNLNNNVNNLNNNKSKFSNMSFIKQDQSNLYEENNESSFLKDIKEVVEIKVLDLTKASSKKSNGYYNFYNINELNSNDVYDTLKF